LLAAASGSGCHDFVPSSSWLGFIACLLQIPWDTALRTPLSTARPLDRTTPQAAQDPFSALRLPSVVPNCTSLGYHHLPRRHPERAQRRAKDPCISGCHPAGACPELAEGTCFSNPTPPHPTLRRERKASVPCHHTRRTQRDERLPGA